MEKGPIPSLDTLETQSFDSDEFDDDELVYTDIGILIINQPVHFSDVPNIENQIGGRWDKRDRRGSLDISNKNTKIRHT